MTDHVHALPDLRVAAGRLRDGFRSSVAVRGYRLRLTFLCARRKPIFEVGDDKLSRCEDAMST
jgi:hypothetical protein